MTLKLKKPTTVMEEEFQASQPQMMFDPQVETETGEKKIIQQPITGTVEEAPSRVTGVSTVEGESVPGVNLGAIGSVARGFNDIILALPDAAINAVVDGLEMAGIVDKVDEPRNFLSRVFNSSDYKAQRVIIPYVLNYGVDDYIGQVEEGAIGRYARAAGQGFGMATPFVGITSKAAQLSTKTPQLVEAGKTGQRIVKSVLDPYLKAPGTTVALEGTGGALAGIGGQAEKDIFGTETGIGATLTVLSLPGLYVAGKKIGDGFKWMFNKIGEGRDALKIREGTIGDLTTGTRGKQASGMVKRELDKVMESETAQTNVQRAKEIEDAILGEGALTPAEQTLDEPFLSSQLKMERSGTPDFTRKNLKRKSDNLAKIDEFINDTLKNDPLSEGPLYIVDQAKNRVSNVIAKVDNDLDQVTTKLSALSDAETGSFKRFSTTAKKEESENLRQTVIEAHNLAKEQAENYAKKLEINQTDIMVRMDAFNEAQEALKGSILTKEGQEALSYEGVNPLIKRFIETPKRTISFQDWKSFRDQVSSEIGKAAALNKKGELRQLAILGETLDDLGKAYGTVNTNFEKFRKYYNENVILPYEDGYVIKLTSTAPGSTKDFVKYALPGEEVAETFLQNSNSAEQFMRLFSDNGRMLKHMKNVVLDQIRTKAYNAGKAQLDPNKINKYINDNEAVLDILKIKNDLVDEKKLLTDLLNRNANLTNRKRLLSQKALIKAIANAENTDEPLKILDNALKNPKLLKELKNSVTKSADGFSQEELLQSFRATMTERLLNKAPNALENPLGFKKFLVNNETIMNQAFDKSHVDNMYLVADALERVLKTGFEGGKGLGQDDIITAVTTNLGTSPAGISNRFIAVQEGRLGPRAAILYVVSRAFRATSSARTDALFREMMFDPEIAKMLTAEGSTNLSIPPQVQRRLNAFLFQLGVDYNEIDATERGDPLKVILEPEVEEQSSAAPAMQNMQTTPPVNTAVTTVTPSPAPVQMTNVSPDATKTTASELFPFDPTLAAIERRRNQKEGIMSVT